MTQLPHVHPTVVHMLLDAAAHSPDREALVFGDERLTYAQYLRCVMGFAGELHRLGVRGQRVALVMANSIDICVAYFAVHMAGAQVVPLNPAYTMHELEPMIADAAPSMIVYDATLSEHIGPLAACLGIEHTICVGGPGGRRLTACKDRSDVESVTDLPRPGDLATLQYTGGTTGRSKGVDMIHAALSVNISQREALVPTRKDTERLLCVMPLFHCYAVAMGLHNMAYCRGTLVLMPHYRPADLLETLTAEKITILGGSPTLFTGLLGYPDFEKTDFHWLDTTYSGSSALPAELLSRWESVTHAPIIEGYGQSESGPVVTFNPRNGKRKPASVGIPIPDTEVEIVDLETGRRALSRGEQGEIRARGPQIMRGYRNHERETRQALRGGWLYTGDIGEFDEEGYLFIRGRKKEMIIVSGYNVYPREIEELLHQHPEVREAAVVGRPDAHRGELPVAYVVPRENTSIDPDALREYCAQYLTSYKLPSEVHLLDVLPKTSVGKVDKLALARRAREQSRLYQSN